MNACLFVCLKEIMSAELPLRRIRHVAADDDDRNKDEMSIELRDADMQRWILILIRLSSKSPKRVFCSHTSTNGNWRMQKWRKACYLVCCLYGTVTVLSMQCFIENWNKDYVAGLKIEDRGRENGERERSFWFGEVCCSAVVAVVEEGEIKKHFGTDGLREAVEENGWIERDHAFLPAPN